MSKLTHRYIARIVLEADTALFVGSGEGSLLKDALVTKDANGFPVLPGTSLTGVLRHALLDTNQFLEKDLNEIFGYQNSSEGLGSRVIISNGHMFFSQTKISEGLNLDAQENLTKMDNLPTRQHVRISSKGAAEKGGLFDNEVVYKGVQFIFEMELKGTAQDKDTWNKLLTTISSPFFRIGSGTRNGYGSLKVLTDRSKQVIWNLSQKEHFKSYLHHPTSLSEALAGGENLPKNDSNTSLLSYTLELTPDDFFIFSEGNGDGDVDNKPVTEEVLIYTEGGYKFEPYTLIPGSSIKGAIAHRVSYHFNLLKGRYSEELISGAKNSNGELSKKDQAILNLFTGSGNKAVQDLFGLGSGNNIVENIKNYNGQTQAYDGADDPSRGHVIIDDIYLSGQEVDNSKIFNHVAIDRFTGGAMDNMLFSEKVSHLNKGKDEITIHLHLDKANIDHTSIEALENTLLDITKGLLPLGGMTTKGHGMFTGSLTKLNGGEPKPITEYQKK